MAVIPGETEWNKFKAILDAEGLDISVINEQELSELLKQLCPNTPIIEQLRVKTYWKQHFSTSKQSSISVISTSFSEEEKEIEEAIAAMETKNWNEACKHLFDALKINSQFIPALLLSYSIYFHYQYSDPLLFRNNDNNKIEKAIKQSKEVTASEREKSRKYINRIVSINGNSQTGFHLFLIGYWFYHIDQNYEEAIKYYKISSEKGNSFSQWELGLCFSFGQGVQVNYEEAFKYYKLSADQSDSIAQNNVGWCYEQGLGVAQNLLAAVKMLLLNLNLGNVISVEKGVQQDYSEALKWFKISADNGNSNGQNAIGNCYYYGKGVKQSYSEAVKWYKLSADQGYAKAQCNLGICYEKGDGFKKNYEEAAKWYKLSADQGNLEAKKALERFKNCLIQ